MCQGAGARLIFHSQGPLLWGTRPSWDESVPAEVPTSVLRSIKISVAALRQDDGQLSGESLIGSTLLGEDSDGLPVEVVVCGVDSQTDPGTNWTSLEAWNPLSKSWENPCVATSAIPNPRALLLAGAWDSRGAHVDVDGQVTVACETGVLAKCATWGYRPWGVNYLGKSLALAHQSCTRMARADYCGDGVSHTREGNLIDHYDVVGVATLDSGKSAVAGETFEGAWGPDGAFCFTRLRDGKPAEVLDQECPGRFKRYGYVIQYGDRCEYGVYPVNLHNVDLRTRTIEPSSTR